MTKRTLTITTNPDWQAALRAVGKRAEARSYRGEVLNFETAGSFFGKLTERRWALMHILQGRGHMTIRELSRRAGRDVRRVHDDVGVLAELGLVERTESGGVECPFASVHIDMKLKVREPEAA